MSRTTHRVLAWLGVAALAAGLVRGARFLPGAGGPAAELRRLLAQPEPRPRLFHRAALILRAARDRRPQGRAELFRDLLRDPDPQVVHHALLLLGDVLRTGEPDDAEVGAAFTDWFTAASLPARIEHLPHALVCAALAANPLPRPAAAPRVAAAPLPENWPYGNTPDERRWLVAASLLRDGEARELAGMLLFQTADDAVCVRDRLELLDARATFRYPDPAAPDARVAAVAPASLRAQLRVDVDELADMLDDPLPQVRWAAGRILTVAGDPRGLPAFQEWLRAARPIPPAAAAMLNDLFGPEWSIPDARGLATRDASRGTGSR